MPEIPFAVKTVNMHSDELTGREIIDLVEKVVAEYDDAHFVTVERYFDGPTFQIGLSTYEPYKNLWVVPNLNVPFFTPRECYNSLLVTSPPMISDVLRWFDHIDDCKRVMAKGVVDFAKQLEAAIQALLFPEPFVPPGGYDKGVVEMH
jgi:hypothetical protein